LFSIVVSFSSSKQFTASFHVLFCCYISFLQILANQNKTKIKLAYIQMKKFKIEFSLTLIPTLAVMICALLVAIFLSTTMNIANADSFPFSPSTSVQSQLPNQQQQQPPPPPPPQGTHMIKTDSNDLGLTDHPLAFSLLLPPLQQPPSQQHPLNANGINNSHNDIIDDHSPSIVSISPF
jgi:hypothetical protein